MLVSETAVSSEDSSATAIKCSYVASYIILQLTHFRGVLWTRTPLNWREVEGCKSYEWKEQHPRTHANSSITHQK